MKQVNTKRYDRQLRLWHEHGQIALENANVCAINGSSATGTEILKNLVLPGVGAFTIVDGATVTKADVGNNFFLTQDCIGKPRAKQATEFLLELNQEVEGNHVEEDAETLIENKIDFFKKYSLIISLHLNEKHLLKLADFCWNAKIPLVVVRTYGFVGYLRLVTPEHDVVETHPDQIFDLRLDVPFEALKKFEETFDYTKMDSMAKSHTPYVVILLKCLKEFKSKSKHPLPSNSEEKSKFKEMIKAEMADLSEPENFEEALAAAFRAFNPTKVSSHLQKVLDDPACTSVGPTSSNFWIIAKAVKDFIESEGNGLPPLAGVVPDMKSDTESFVHLQKLYRESARSDAQVVFQKVNQVLLDLDRPADSIPFEEVERFCKNSQYLKVIKYKSLKEEYSSTTNPVLENLLRDLDNNAVYYILLRAVDRFCQTHRRYPGVHNGEVESDIPLLKKCVVAVLDSLGLGSDAVSDDHIHSMVRAGNSEMHNMAAIQGGIASQEIIKLITKQYCPLQSTMIFNGMKSSSAVFNL